MLMLHLQVVEKIREEIMDIPRDAPQERISERAGRTAR